MGFAFIMFLLVTIIAVAVDNFKTKMRRAETQGIVDAANFRTYGGGVDNIKEFDIILRKAKELFDKAVEDGVTNGAPMSAEVYERYKLDIRNKYCNNIDPFDWCIKEANLEMGKDGYCAGWRPRLIAATYYMPQWAIKLGGTLTYDDYEHPESIYKGLKLYNKEFNELTFLYRSGDSSLRDYCKYGYLKAKEESERRFAYKNRGFSDEEIDKITDNSSAVYEAIFKKLEPSEPVNEMLDEKYTGHPLSPINQKYRKKK